jgi:hypothetical protein
MISFSSFLLVMEGRWNEIDRGNRSTRGKTCPSATLSTRNPILTDPESNPDLSGERLATNRLSYAMACTGILATWGLVTSKYLCIYRDRHKIKVNFNLGHCKKAQRVSRGTDPHFL